MSLSQFIDCSSEVRAALDRGAPLVALETTIVTHGMPYPQNVATARKVESIVRDGGAVPATIAVIGGRIRIGLSHEELEWLGTAKDVLKLSRADLPFAVATGRDGATTVAGTMMCAALAGVSVFATGGIGGVHRDAESSMDVSADLEELARTPVVVVCAGAKALLDLSKTLEVLETRGVAVVGYRTDEFPAFWSRSSGLPAPLRLDSVDAIASLIDTQRDLDIVAGTVIANPIPVESEISAPEMAKYIDLAIAQAKAAGVVGKAVTPWLLDRIYALTCGKSLTANIALIENNARLATEIAIALSSFDKLRMTRCSGSCGRVKL